MITFRKIATAVTLAASLAAMSTPAHAGGFLSDTFIRPFSPEAADAADAWNKQNGHPVEQAAGAAINGWVPGGGTVAQEVWARNGGYQGPSGIQWGGNGGFAPPPQQQFQMGNFCYTPAGRFGPGPGNSLGAPCLANTPYGPMQGQIGN